MKDRKISIEIHSLCKDLIRNLWVVVLAVLIGRMGIYIASHSVYLPEYTSSATLVVSAKTSSGTAYTNYTVSTELADVFVGVFSDSVMKAKASEYMGKSFNGNISAKVNSGTNFITLSVTSDSPKNSYEMLNAVLNVYPDVSDYVFDNATLTLLRSPSMPHSPSNAISSDNAALIQSGCAILAVFAIVVISLMRDTIKTENDYKEKIDAKLVGIVNHEKKQMALSDRIKRKKKSLRIHSNAFVSVGYIETFHKICAKLEYMHKRNGDKVFVITSLAENEGKSTIASNIALALAERDKKVILVDFDFKKPALYKIFEKDYSENSELGYYFEGKISKGNFKLLSFKNLPMLLAVNTMPHKDSSKWIEDGSAEQFINNLASKADYVIIDTPPFFVDASVAELAKFADKVINVVRTDTVNSQLISDSLVALKDSEGKFAGCILNDVHPEISLFDISGADETGAYRYGKYGHYGKYSKYAKYGKYGSYGYFGKYGKYGNYGYYQKSDNDEK